MDSTRKVKGTLRTRYWTLNGPAVRLTDLLHSLNLAYDLLRPIVSVRLTLNV